MLHDITARDAAIAADDERQPGQAALRQAHDFLGRFISYPSREAHDAHALWIAHAHLMHHWDTTPRLAFLSPEPASGKTRALEITALLVPNAIATMNVSTAYLFRRIAAPGGPPTVCYDEVDTVFGAKTPDHDNVRAGAC